MSRFKFFEESFSVPENSHTNTHQTKVGKDIIKENEVEPSISGRYRCEQINLIKINDMPTMHATLRTELLCSFYPQKMEAQIKLQDYTQEISDDALATGLEMVKGIEEVKGDVFVKINNNGKIEHILNLEELNKKWIYYKNHELVNLEVFKEMKRLKMQAASDILEYGDLEFSDEKILKSQYDRNLFFHTYFDDYLTRGPKELNGDSISFMSQIFQNTTIKLERQPLITAENDLSFTVNKTGVIDKESLNEEELKRQYNLLYLPLVKYNYTSFEFEYNMKYTIDKKSGMLMDGSVDIFESVKNNYESICSFQI